MVEVEIRDYDATDPNLTDDAGDGYRIVGDK
jgi:hypothetical protein